jgi:hypothetical protein
MIWMVIDGNMVFLVNNRSLLYSILNLNRESTLSAIPMAY